LSERMVQVFRGLVKIDSESGEEERFLDHLKGLLEEALAAKCVRDSYGNLIARLPGRNSKRERPLLFACHGDTVKPGKGIEPIINGDVIRSKGETFLGADDKAGIAQFIEAVRTSDYRPPIEFIVTREEETGLVGVRHLDVSQLDAKEGFVLDMDALDAVVVGGPSHMLIDVKIHGRAAHAAMEPENGISAVLAASRAIVALPLGRIDPGTTANVGIIEGGQIRNGIPDRVLLKAECRGLEHNKCLDVSRRMEAVFVATAEAMGATAQVKSELAYRASAVPESARVVTWAKEAIRSIGLDPKVQTICGGTDASIYNEKGIQTVVLGIGVKAEHSTEEHIHISDMAKSVKIIHHIFKAAMEE